MAEQTLIIPTVKPEGTNSFVQIIYLDETYYKFRFDYNARDDRWYMGMFTVDDVAIVTGIKLVINFELIQFYKNPLLPKGNLFLIDTSDTDEECGLDDLGTRCLLVYYRED